MYGIVFVTGGLSFKCVEVNAGFFYHNKSLKRKQNL